MSLTNILNCLDKVTKTGQNAYKAICPCHAENTPSLTIKEDGNNIMCHCFGCGANGMEVVQALGLESSELFNESRKMAEKNQPGTVELEREQNRKFLDEVREQTKPLFDGCAVNLYLNKRGIKIIPNTIRFLPEYKQDGKYHPCLIARLDDKDGNRVSYKIIHLDNNGNKADVPIVKKTLPCERDTDGMAVRLFKYNGTLAVCEGIETALSYYNENKIACWALDNALNMKKFIVPMDVKNLLIIADMDSSFTGQAAAYELARRSAALIGKDGYQLERVNVILLLKWRGELSEMVDSGQKTDYLDYCND